MTYVYDPYPSRRARRLDDVSHVEERNAARGSQIPGLLLVWLLCIVSLTLVS
jgi:hypothetical protein